MDVLLSTVSPEFLTAVAMWILVMKSAFHTVIKETFRLVCWPLWAIQLWRQQWVL